MKTEASMVPSFALRWAGAVCPIREGLSWLSQLGMAPAPCTAVPVLRPWPFLPSCCDPASTSPSLVVCVEGRTRVTAIPYVAV